MSFIDSVILSIATILRALDPQIRFIMSWFSLRFAGGEVSASNVSTWKFMQNKIEREAISDFIFLSTVKKIINQVYS